MIKFIKQIHNRFYEILPGALTWLTFILAIVISAVKPIWAIFFIIIFDLYWLAKVYYLVIHQAHSWFEFKKQVKINWFEKLKNLKAKDWKNYTHLIFLPTYKEPFEIIDRTFSNLSKVIYDTHKFIVVLAGEERDKSNFLSVAKQIEDKYSQNFFKILVTVHPKNLPDEIPGKGSNTNFAGHQAKKLIDELRIPYENVIVSNFDIDTQAHPQYFAYLTYKYLTHPKPTRVSYQPIALYHNNIWESDPLTRVVANSTTFWLLTDLARSERLFTFSSHSMSFKALVDVGFWQKDIVSEDSRIFLQCLLKYNGDYKVEPMYMPVSMNTVYTGSLGRSIRDQYRQMRRWAWGCEHVPYMAKEFKKNKDMLLRLKLKHFFNQLEGTWTWATAPILITIMGRLPLWMADREVDATALAQITPLILQWLMTFALAGLIINAFLSTVLMPKNESQKKSWYIYPQMFLEWILFPLTMIIFGSIPATDAQTRLMLGGKYKLGFWVSGKK